VFDHAAVAGPGGVASSGAAFEALQLVTQLPHLPYPVVELADLATDQFGHVAAWLLAPVPEGDDLLDLVQTEPQALGRLDEPETLGVDVGVVPVPRRARTSTG